MLPEGRDKSDQNLSMFTLTEENGLVRYSGRPPSYHREGTVIYQEQEVGTKH